jgi:hypothetical protein
MSGVQMILLPEKEKKEQKSSVKKLEIRSFLTVGMMTT